MLSPKFNFDIDLRYKPCGRIKDTANIIFVQSFESSKGLFTSNSIVIMLSCAACVSAFNLNVAKSVNLHNTEGQLGKPCNCIVTY